MIKCKLNALNYPVNKESTLNIQRQRYDHVSH